MIDQKELDAIFDRHERWLEGRPGGERAVLVGTDLSHAVIRGRNLSQAVLCCSDFRSAKLIDCRFMSTCFRNSRFSGVDILNCDLTSADLCETKFGAGALLANSNFEFALAQNIDLRDTCIYRSSFRDADLAGAKADLKLIFQRPAILKGGVA